MQLPREPMLTAPTSSALIPRGFVAEPKWDGFRCFVARWADGAVVIRSRNGTDMTRAFPEIAEAAIALPTAMGDVLFDGVMRSVDLSQGRMSHGDEWVGAAATGRREQPDTRSPRDTAGRHGAAGPES